MLGRLKRIQERIIDKAAELVADKITASHPTIDAAKMNAKHTLEAAKIGAKAQKDAALIRTSFSSTFAAVSAVYATYNYIRPIEDKIKAKDGEIDHKQKELDQEKKLARDNFNNAMEINMELDCYLDMLKGIEKILTPAPCKV